MLLPNEEKSTQPQGDVRVRLERCQGPLETVACTAQSLSLFLA